MLPYSNRPFEGKETELEFPSLTLSHKGEGEKALLRVHYLLQDKTLLREEEPLKESLKNEPQRKRLLEHKVRKLLLEYAFTDEEGKGITFLPFWLEEPYQGIPKAIRVTLELDQEGSPVSLTKLIDLPQGNLGVLPQEELKG
jgi:hypothetical protein